MPDKNTNELPILDDIIKSGDADKTNKQYSTRPEDESGKPSSTAINADADLHTEFDQDPGIPEFFTEDQPGVEFSIADEPTQEHSSAEAGNTQALQIDAPDIDNLTEEILGSMMPELEQLLRKKIRQALKQHIPD